MESPEQRKLRYEASKKAIEFSKSIREKKSQETPREKARIARMQEQRTRGGFWGQATSPEHRLAQLGKTIIFLVRQRDGYTDDNGIHVDGRKDELASSRAHQYKLMREYGVTLMPSESELRRKYPLLSNTIKKVASLEDEVGRLDFAIMRFSAERAKLEQQLGIREPPPPDHIQYTQMKKFVPSQTLDLEGAKEDLKKEKRG